MHAFLIIRTGVGLWLEHNAFLHAGALAFFTLFSLAPTLIIAVAVIWRAGLGLAFFLSGGKRGTLLVRRLRTRLYASESGVLIVKAARVRLSGQVGVESG